MLGQQRHSLRVREPLIVDDQIRTREPLCVPWRLER
jgi:hypothetical protein